MGQDPDAIRQDLAQTRADMGETVDAVGDKADMPSRAKEAVADKADARQGEGQGGDPAGQAGGGWAHRPGRRCGNGDRFAGERGYPQRWASRSGWATAASRRRCRGTLIP
jgi:hypothetical protein